MSSTNRTASAAIAPLTAAGELDPVMERLEWLLAGLHSARNDAADLVHSLDDTDLNFDLGTHLEGIKRSLAAMDALLADAAARRAQADAAAAALPAGIVEVA